MNKTPALRINHFLAQAGICSRRKADELIAAQKVRINGEIAAPGSRVTRLTCMFSMLLQENAALSTRRPSSQVVLALSSK